MTGTCQIVDGRQANIKVHRWKEAKKSIVGSLWEEAF